MNRRTAAYSLALMVLCLLVAAALRLPDLPGAPPGLHYDEAANGILAGDIGLRGDRPIFISSYTGKEIAFFYLAGGLMRLVGESVFSLRLTAAYLGILTVAATYWLGQEMLADRRQALLAAALLAVSFWHVLFSRLGFRAITEPLLQALAMAALFRGLRRDDKRWLIAAGVLLGLTAYTYLAARVFPVLVMLGLLPILFSRENRRLRWTQIAVFLGAALVTLLPLLLYFAANPDTFWVRIGQVAPGSQEGPGTFTIWRSLLESWGMFFLRGDTFLRFNLPGRPLFGWISGGLLLVGWLICIIRWRRFPYDWQRAAIALLIFAPLIMILPTALAVNELVPSNLRAIGLIPFLFYLPAIGFVILFADLEKRFGFPPLQAAVILAALLILLSGGLATAQTYFGQWVQEPRLLYETDGDLVAVSQFLEEQALDGRHLYVAAPHYRHPTIAFLSASYADINWLPQSRALVFPAGGESLYVYPHNSPRPDWAGLLLENATRITSDNTSYPDDAYEAYLLTDRPSLDITHPLQENFGGVVTLLGYDVAPTAAGSDLPLSLYWQVTGTPRGDYQPFVQLEDEYGHRWSQVEPFAYPSEQWQEGDTIVQRIEIPVPAGMPPGDYLLRIGLFEQATGERAPRLDSYGNYAGDAVLLSDITITAGGMPDSLPSPPFPLDQQMTPDLTLLGYERGPLAVANGESWGLALWWSALDALPDLELSLELLNEAGEDTAVLQTQPAYDTYPFSAWTPPQLVIDRQQLTVPADTPPGSYRLRLRLTNSSGETLGTADLGPLEIEVTERLFNAPPLAESLSVTFGEEIALLGYDLGPVSDHRAQLTLVWQAQQAPKADYTVFVHLLNLDGSCCIWQQDSAPVGGAYATSRWLPDEVVIDPYEIVLPDDLPPGDYPLEVGLYVAETGQRLSAAGEDETTADAVFLKPLAVP